MDYVNPIQAVMPDAQGRLLAVLAQTTHALKLRTLADLAGVSKAQASRVLPRLVRLGIVSRTEVSPAALFSLVRDNLAARTILDLLDLRQRLLRELAGLAKRLRPEAASVCVFGSLARGLADADSDIDVLIVRAAGVADDDRSWTASLAEWTERAAGVAGNPISVIEIGEEEVPDLLGTPRHAPWDDIAREAVLVAGRALAELSASASRG